MRHVRQWEARIYLFEDDDNTTARAELETGSATLVGEGHARRNRSDQPVPEIGDEIAVGRALAALAQKLESAAEEDLAAVRARQ